MNTTFCNKILQSQTTTNSIIMLEEGRQHLLEGTHLGEDTRLEVGRQGLEWEEGILVQQVVHLEDNVRLVHWVHLVQKDQYKVEASLVLHHQFYRIYQQQYRMVGLQMRTLGLKAAVVAVAV